ncbi:L-aspartate oxidase [Pseudooceanicola sp. CBS1P-1]|uniref:L-aspartate oxidase n=1 Tax=Pseudooceanicola albus TaxID=2692189 RepID=A0A6L7FZI4_9RHOB|nr:MULTISPECIES: L-aspartate oxidase [Pseudooceanicola]MBT9382656.1 L-aspartate oxidase [Pseudooceanicola endophyticus]MXN17195.1 L-aspartate oxidase [Pseudooceanicola albus]
MPETGRVVILGAGLAALSAALELAPYPVLVISPEPLGQGASSAWAQGGVAAAMALPDTPEAHARDTLRAGAGLVDPEVAASVTAEARARIFGLAELGAPFDRDDQGGFLQSREAAHSFARVVRVGGDSAGAAIMATLVAQVRATPSVQVLEGVSATGLLVEAGRVIGVALAREGQAPVALKAPAVLLASGGAGGLYALATNPARIRGQGLGLAARAGARIGDAEFLQFHPTAIDAGLDPAPLATEALRGEGAILINARGERFMEGLHPDQELAPRDVVARAVFAQSQAGLRPMLDTRAVLGARIDAAFPAVAAACRAAGIDPVHQPIPVAAAAHYHMGGVATDHRGRTSLYGLWACGEVACTGLHGANRLASNGLLEAVVYGRRAAIDIAGGLGAMTAPKVVLPETAPLAATDPALIARLRRTMSDHAGVIRTERGLIRALAEIARIEALAPEDPHLLNMTAAATLIASAALLRQESRGGHYRADHPQVDGETGERRRMTLNLALACRAAALTEDAA